jgi:predicted Zn-dependent protease
VTLVGNELAARVLERALQHGGDFGEVYAEERYGFALGIDDSKIERPQTGSERGAAVRVVQGDATYFGHVDGLAEQDLLRVADSVAQAVRAGDSRTPAALSAASAEVVHPSAQRRSRQRARPRSCASATHARGRRATRSCRCWRAMPRIAARSRSSTPTA